MPEILPFTVEPHGEKWAVKSGEEVLLVCATRREAEGMADGAWRNLRPVDALPPEPRSFDPVTERRPINKA